MSVLEIDYPNDFSYTGTLVTPTNANCVAVSTNWAFVGCTDLAIAHRQEMPGILGCSINGPTNIYAGVNYTWQASVYGGTAPYTYSWAYANGCGEAEYIVGTTATLTTFVGRDGCLRLTVTSADGQKAFRGWRIVTRRLTDIGIGMGIGMGKI